MTVGDWISTLCEIVVSLSVIFGVLPLVIEGLRRKIDRRRARAEALREMLEQAELEEKLGRRQTHVHLKAVR